MKTFLNIFRIPLVLMVLSAIALSLEAQANSANRRPPFPLIASMGKIKGVTPNRKFGINFDVDTAGVPVLVSSAGNVTVPTQARLIVLTSTDANDTSDGTGARAVRVEGLDSDYNELIEDFVLSGTSNVTSTGEFIAINRAYGISAGSGQVNAGNISIKHGSDTLAEVPAGQGQSQQFLYTIPANKTWIVDNITASQNKKGSGTVTVEYQIMVFGTNIWRNIFPVGLGAAGSSYLQTIVGTGRFVALPSKTIVRAMVTSASANDNEVTASAAGFLVDNETFKF